MIPKIFDGQEPLPGVNAGVICLEGGMRASLNWAKEREKAQQLVAKGFAILWEIDLGINGKLRYPYNNAMQHQSLGLALDHFKETLWKEFQTETLGLVLYRGSADHATHFHFEKSEDPFYCTRVVVNYLQLLAMRLPDALPLFVLLDCSTIEDPFLLGQLVSRELYSPLHLCLKGAPFADQEMVWEEGSSPLGFIGKKVLQTEPTDVKTALVLPPGQRIDPFLQQMAAQLQAKRVPFRTIAEEHLTESWDNLDLLYYSPNISHHGRRMLQGFEAAGGTVACSI